MIEVEEKIHNIEKSFTAICMSDKDGEYKKAIADKVSSIIYDLYEQPYTLSINVHKYMSY